MEVQCASKNMYWRKNSESPPNLDGSEIIIVWRPGSKGVLLVEPWTDDYSDDPKIRGRRMWYEVGSIDSDWPKTVSFTHWMPLPEGPCE